MNKKIKENKSIIIKCYFDDFKNNSLIYSSVTKASQRRYAINFQQL
jgi:hypothetical protein